MKKTKKIGLLLTFFITIAILFCNSNFAQSTTPGKYLGLYGKGNGRPTGYYTSGRKNGGSSAPLPIIKIVEYTDAGGTSPKNTSEALYCIKDGIGFGSENSQSSIVQYNQYFDFKDKSKISSPYNSESVFPQGENYNKLLWLLDNICIPEDEDSVNTLLSKVKDSYGDSLNKDAFLTGMTAENNSSKEQKFKDLIEVIQQAAIWYITNANGQYQPTKAETFYVGTQNGGANKVDICSKYSYDEEECPIDALYDYLISEPERHKTYTSNTSNQALTLIKNGVTIENSNGHYVIGPYKITKNSDNYTNFSATVTANAITQTDIKILNSSKVEITGNNISDKIKSTIGNNFYIQVPVNSIKNNTDIKISISALNINREITYWSTPSNSNTSNQPVVEIKDEKINFSADDTQTLKPDLTNITVTKVWEDSNNQDNIRPQNVKVQLLADNVQKGETIELNEGNSWTYTFLGLDKYDKSGKVINYTVKEANTPNGYTSSLTGDAASGYTITNTHITTNISIPVEKIWSDNNDQDGLRLEEVEVELLADGEVSQTVKLNASNNWKHTFTNLQKNNSDRREIVYTVREKTEIPEYTKTVSGNQTDGFTITNYHKTDKTQVSVKKVWDDSDNAQSTRPSSVVVELLANGEVKNEATLNEGNNWQYTFTDLDTDKDGQEIFYTVIEKDLPRGYTAQITGNSRSGFVIKNTYKKFDLALRKYITKINDVLLKDLNIPSRNPNINDTGLESKQDTTADYNHKKDPILVKNNDKVTYNITIYNEGEKTGYASQIIDQLPRGLVLLSSGTVTSTGSDGQEKNTYKIQYNENTNRVIFEIQDQAKDLKTFDGDLDYETIEIDCKVNYEAMMGNNGILTNVAYISNDYDTEDNTNGSDIDSQPSNSPNVNKDNMENYKGKNTNPDDLSDSNHYYEGEEDDDDFEKVYIKNFDLALRKFITAVNETELKTNGEYDRAPTVDVSPLLNGEKTADYKHSKEPIKVKVGDIVTYTLRIYNEGQVDGYADEIVDHLPPELEFLPNDEMNKKYLWTLDSSDETGRTIKTTYLSKAQSEENILKGFNGEGTLDYKDIQVRCKVKNTTEVSKKITNIAEITASNNEYNIPDRDNDEKVKLPNDSELPNYKGNDDNKEDLTDKDYHYEGQEDDDDFEKIILEKFDLALRKFITGVNDEEITTRVPQVDTSKYGTIVDGKEITNMEYTHPKDPVRVANNDVVTYTIRVYNEGTQAGYAAEIKDDIPAGLEFIQDHEINKEYKWIMYDKDGNITTEIKKAETIATDYLSKENEKVKGENLLKGFDPTTMDTPDYKDVKIAFRVTEPNTSDRTITNKAQISKDTDEEGEEVDDTDSTPNEWNEGEDDQDVEHLYVKYFDLALRKWVSQAILIEDGIQKEMDTDHYAEQDPEPVVKVELNKDRIENTIVKFRYQIRITNEGEIEGYATEISDYIPEGLKFNQADNPKWREENGKIVTDQLKDTLLQPGESATVEVLLTWINGDENLNLKINVAEISKDSNPSDSPDIDSTPNNKKDGEDDMDDAPVILTVVTGIAQTYIAIIAGAVLIFGAGALIIKKYVV